jgi:hypothetical protein
MELSVEERSPLLTKDFEGATSAPKASGKKGFPQ